MGKPNWAERQPLRKVGRPGLDPEPGPGRKFLRKKGMPTQNKPGFRQEKSKSRGITKIKSTTNKSRRK